MAVFPSMLEYQETVQHPGACFSDAELAGGAIVLDALGLPKPITGGFASVYQVKTKKKHFAVRCFVRSHDGVQDRYSRISDFQKKHRPKWMAEFVYVTQGIKVRGQWYPVLKMEWIQGDQLNVHLDRIAGNKKAIATLADKFQALLKTMANLGLAHGDLQHGNILVDGGELRLIDYDAMFVPGMTGRSHEVGHRNYQHPKRGGSDFGSNLDSFSAWVILIALRALALAPQLWKELDGGDEGLLLRKEDFLKPDESKALKAIEKIADASLRADLDTFRKALAGEPSAVPSPLAAPAAAPAPAPKAQPAPAPKPEAVAPAKKPAVVSTPAAAATTAAAPSPGPANPAAAKSPAPSPGPANPAPAAAKSPAPAPSPVKPAPAAAKAPAPSPAKPAPQAATAPASAAATPTGSPQILAAPVTAERIALIVCLGGAGACAFAFTHHLLTDELAGAGILAALSLLLLVFYIRYASLPEVQRLREHETDLEATYRDLARCATRTKALEEIDAFTGKNLRLDFEALADSIGAGAGQEVLDRIMEFLEEQAVSGSPVATAEPDLGRRLARKGLKNALRLSDVIVSTSMAAGESAESLTVVLRGGKEFEEPALTRPHAEALLAWRVALEKTFVAKAAGEELILHEELTKRVDELRAVIALYTQVNVWRFLGQVFGFG